MNAWLEQHPDRPGCYPSGGPVGKLIPLWKKAAPSLDLIAPDIYLPDLKGVCEEYSVCGNTLFIPEARRDPVTASNAFYALGGMNAIGFSPFAVEDFLKEEMEGPEASLLAALNIEVDGFSCRGTGPYLVRSYQVLNELYPLLLKWRGTDRMTGFIRRNPYEREPLFLWMVMIFSWIISLGKQGSRAVPELFSEKKTVFIYQAVRCGLPLCRKREVIHILQL